MTNRKQSRLVDQALAQGATEVTTEQPKRLSDLQPKIDSISIEGFVGHDITVKSFDYRASQFGEEGSKYVVITADTANGNNILIRTGSEVLIKKLEEHKALMPYIATVKKLGRAYTLD